MAKALVIGTTGHDDAEKSRVTHHAARIPMVLASNYSTGVNTLFWLTRKAAEILGDSYDLEVVEMHHRLKKDAPSGTAKSLAEILADVRKEQLFRVARHGREGIVGERTAEEIGVHSIRGGDVVGIPPQFLVGHSALESGWGRNEIRRADGTSSYNLFGIKAGKNWAGASVEGTTTEYVNGQAQQVVERFRADSSYEESFRDYASLLRNNSRYSGVIGSQDGTEFAKRLQQAGYATDPMYAEKLSRIINGPTRRQALIG